MVRKFLVIIFHNFMARSLGQKDFISIDENENRLLFMLNEADVDGDVISIRKSLLKR